MLQPADLRAGKPSQSREQPLESRGSEPENPGAKSCVHASMPVEPQLILDELELGSGGPLYQAEFEVGERHSAVVDLLEHVLETDAILMQDVRKAQLTVGLHSCTVDRMIRR